MANTFDSDVRFRRDGVSVDGKSVMDLLTLSLAPGVGFSVQIEGADEAVAIEEMARHFVHGIPEEKCPGFLRFVANLELTAGQNFETMNPLTALTAFTKDLLARGVCQWKAMP